MRFKSYQIPGKGRGKFLGFPTINLKIPKNLNLDRGIYAAKVRIGQEEKMGAMHYGPIPVFNETEFALEVFIIDAPENFNFEENETLEIEPVRKIRDVINFSSPDELSKQISLDVETTRSILNN